ncbi:C4-dicarboxylate transporter/malic acid transport protein [Magnetospirillum molischianum DSM 120]|uniref:C4-dicarboxylate transporter/malic acid transport protein n=2 Tax=Magnetospirillum molischianum TaxID=1083 RepID=H8FPN5_MAGML|nr:C4-dicarboxylate transporter/malic acid transport protein [Magnetospirillum molischianum DSM 120]
MSGLTIALHKLEGTLGLTGGVSQGVFAVSLALFAGLAGLYLLKLIRYPGAVAEEWRNPVRISFFPSISVGLILLGTAAQPVDVDLARILWSMGAGGHLLLTLAVMSSWINQTHYEIVHSNPAWFIPVVGNIVVPIAGVKFAPADLSWFFFAIGLLFWLVLLTIVFYRLIFHTPLPGKLVPTLFILLAPPSAGFIAWVAIVGEIDAFARLLYAVAVFLFLLLMVQVPRFSGLSFTLSWWAYSFPLAAFSIATMVIGEKTRTPLYAWAGIGLGGLLSLVIAGLFGRTVLAVIRDEICRPEA